jgi:hypothetical protein
MEQSVDSVPYRAGYPDVASQSDQRKFFGAIGPGKIDAGGLRDAEVDLIPASQR